MTSFIFLYLFWVSGISWILPLHFVGYLMCLFKLENHFPQSGKYSWLTSLIISLFLLSLFSLPRSSLSQLWVFDSITFFNLLYSISLSFGLTSWGLFWTLSSKIFFIDLKKIGSTLISWSSFLFSYCSFLKIQTFVISWKHVLSKCSFWNFL